MIEVTFGDLIAAVAACIAVFVAYLKIQASNAAALKDIKKELHGRITMTESRVNQLEKDVEVLKNMQKDDRTFFQEIKANVQKIFEQLEELKINVATKGGK